MLIERYTNDSETQLVERASGESYIEGYAIRWYDGTPATEYSLGEGKVERIKKEAFDNALSSGDTVSLRFNHSRDFELDDTAHTLRLVSDNKGLRYTAPFDKEDPDHVKVRAKLKKGLIRGSSFSALARHTWKEEAGTSVAWITEVARLNDVSLVDRSAYQTGVPVIRQEADTEIEASYADWKKTKEETERRINNCPIE